MVQFMQSHGVVVLGAIVLGTVLWAVGTSLVPPRKRRVTLSLKLPKSARTPAHRAVAARG